MAKYKIGITEAGDAGLDLSWEDKLQNVDRAVLITKNITPEFIKLVIRNKDKLIVHTTITGYGGTIIEPNVPCPDEAFAHLSDLVDKTLKSLIKYGEEMGHCIRIEACAEPELKSAVHQGCISSYDLDLLGLGEGRDNDNIGFQRRNCLCYSGKTELLANKKCCPHQCLYCYWK